MAQWLNNKNRESNEFNFHEDKTSYQTRKEKKANSAARLSCRDQSNSSKIERVFSK